MEKMEEFFLNLPKYCAKNLHESDVLELVSANTGVQLKLEDHRLYVYADDVSTAVAAACKVLLTFPNLGTRMHASAKGRSCDFARMLTKLSELHGRPIATSSSLNETDVIHAFDVYSKENST